MAQKTILSLLALPTGPLRTFSVKETAIASLFATLVVVPSFVCALNAVPSYTCSLTLTSRLRVTNVSAQK